MPSRQKLRLHSSAQALQRKPQRAPEKTSQAINRPSAFASASRTRSLQPLSEPAQAEHADFSSLSQLHLLRRQFEQGPNSQERAAATNAPSPSHRPIRSRASATRRLSQLPASSEHWVSARQIQHERLRAQIEQSLYAPPQKTQAQPIQTQEAVRSTQSERLLASARLMPSKSSPNRRTRWQRLRAQIETFMRRLLSFLRQKPSAQRTQKGQAALTHLQSLFDLLLCDFEDGGMDLVAYRVAFGQAYYQVMQASREHYKQHKGKEPEDYQPYFEQFLRELP